MYTLRYLLHMYPTVFFFTTGENLGYLLPVEIVSELGCGRCTMPCACNASRFLSTLQVAGLAAAAVGQCRPVACFGNLHEEELFAKHVVLELAQCDTPLGYDGDH